MGNIEKGMNSTKSLFLGLLTIGLIGLLFLIIYGNLSGNLGFAASSQGANDTTNVIQNLSSGAVTFFTFSNVWFVLGAVALLIVIVVGIIGLVSKIGGSEKFSN